MRRNEATIFSLDRALLYRADGIAVTPRSYLHPKSAKKVSRTDRYNNHLKQIQTVVCCIGSLILCEHVLNEFSVQLQFSYDWI